MSLTTAKTARVGMKSDVPTPNVLEDSMLIVNGVTLHSIVRIAENGKKSLVQIGNVVDMSGTKPIGTIFLITAHVRVGMPKHAKIPIVAELSVFIVLGGMSLNIVRNVKGGTRNDVTMKVVKAQ